MAIRVVVDTNVLVAGLIGGTGPNREVLRRCLQGDLQPFVGNALYLEYQDLLSRENIQALCNQTSVSLMEFLDGFAQVCTAIDARYLWRPNLCLTEKAKNNRPHSKRCQNSRGSWKANGFLVVLID